MNTQSEKWALIPSDPAVFNDMIEQYGTKDTRVVDVFTLDLLEKYKDNTDVHGLIYIFPYEEDELPANFEQEDPLASDIIFTSQVITNACATLALLAALLNADIDKGDLLNSFLQFTQSFSSIDRGLCLGACQEIRLIHNAYASNAHHTAEDAMDVTTEHDNANYEVVDVENYHYITYIYKSGFAWELDGLKCQPVRLQQCTHEEWIATVKPIIQQRMQDRMDVSLMAITRDSYHAELKQKNAHDSYLQLSNEVVKKQLAKRTLSRRKKAFFSIINEADTQYHDTMKGIWSSIYAQDFTSAEAKINAFAMETDPFNRQVDQITAERERAKADSIRQKFDYFPFVQAVLKASFRCKFLHNTSKPTKNTMSMKRKPAKKRS